MVGSVSNLVVAKKFGFISGDNGNEYFFHLTDMITDWNEIVSLFSEHGGGKVRVSFEPTKTPKGPRAKNVMIIDA